MQAGEAPYFITKPEPQRCIVGENLQLQCQVAGKPVPKVSWYKNGVELQIEDRYR